MRPVPILQWDRYNINHVARHVVTPAEVEEVVAHPATRWNRDDSHRAGRLVGFGLTAAQRLLVVYLEAISPQNTTVVVTARPMTARERTAYQEATS